MVVAAREWNLVCVYTSGERFSLACYKVCDIEYQYSYRKYIKNGNLCKFDGFCDSIFIIWLINCWGCIWMFKFCFFWYDLICF